MVKLKLYTQFLQNTLSVLSSDQVFLGIGSLGFLKFWYGTANSFIKLCVQSRIFWKNFFSQKLGNWAVFSDDQHYVRRPCGVCLTELFFYFFIFFENPFWAKLTKNGQKWPQNGVFRFYFRIFSLDVAGICVD